MLVIFKSLKTEQKYSTLIIKNKPVSIMKTNLLIIVATMLLFFPPLNAAPFTDGDDGDPEEIDLGRQGNNENPNSLNAVYVTAYKTTSQVVIEISNYSGNVSAAVIGMGGSVLSNHNPILGMGIIILDISSIPSGNYTLFISADQLYLGSFTK